MSSSVWPAAVQYNSFQELMGFWHTFENPTIHGRDQWLYRGHSDATWHLTPTIERQVPIQDIRAMETYPLHDFRRLAPSRTYLHPKLPAYEDIPSWYSLMRHHGVPTRILDWSYSFPRALFFAADECKSNGGAILAINVSIINERVKDLAPSLISNFAPPLDLSTLDHFNALALYAFDEKEREDVGLVAQISPKEANDRLAAQHGTFLINCNHKLSFEDSLRRMMSDVPDEQWIKKTTFPQSLRIELLHYLYRISATSYEIYPDLDGLGQLLKLKMELFPAGTYR